MSAPAVKKHDVLEGVDRLVAERGLPEERQVPEIEVDRPERKRDERVREEAQALEPRAARGAAGGSGRSARRRCRAARGRRAAGAGPCGTQNDSCSPRVAIGETSATDDEGDARGRRGSGATSAPGCRAARASAPAGSRAAHRPPSGRAGAARRTRSPARSERGAPAECRPPLRRRLVDVEEADVRGRGGLARVRRVGRRAAARGCRVDRATRSARFAGLYPLDEGGLPAASLDGAGTKLVLARKAGRLAGSEQTSSRTA